MKTLHIQTLAVAKLKRDFDLSHPAVPIELKEIVSNTELTHLYLTLKEDILWVAKRKQVAKFDLTKLNNLILTYMTPAKGAGLISIMARAKDAEHYITILDYGVYKDKVLSSATETANEIGRFLGYRVETQNWGADC